MYNISIKNKAIGLRLSGKSIPEISNVLDVNRRTVAYWCGGIVLSKKAKRLIFENSKNKISPGLRKYIEDRNRKIEKKRRENKRIGVKFISDISERDILMIGLGLYWGEGYKYASGEFGFTNSSPKMIRFYIKWLEHLGVKKNRLIFRLAINKVFNRYEKSIKSFWKKFLNVDEAQFSKTTIIKTKLKKKDFSNLGKYKGVLRVKVKMGGALRDRILAAIDKLS